MAEPQVQAGPENQTAAALQREYYSARKNELTFEGMNSARKFAEGAVEEIRRLLPDSLQPEFPAPAKSLGAKLDKLETLTENHPELANSIPRSIVAALRTLQAWGNYASHFHAGPDSSPKQHAVRSAMASLDAVADWYFGAQGRSGHDFDVDSVSELRLIEPAPTTPAFLERRRALKRFRENLPSFSCSEFASSISFGVHALGTDAEEPILRKANVLGAYLEASAAKLDEVCRFVLSREAEAPPVGASLEVLVLQFQALSERRAQRVPRSVVTEASEVARRRLLYRRCATDNFASVDALIADARHSDPFASVVKWFEEKYLGCGPWERSWGSRLWRLVGVLFLAWLVFTIGRGCGEDELRDSLFTAHCTADAGSVAQVCVALRRSGSDAGRPP
ncbi:MAG: hypothetical protein QM765_39020 [Myxococcales bacterium]